MRPIIGPSKVNVSRPNPITSQGLTLGKDETPENIYDFTGDVDIILYNTRKYVHPQKQIGETVIVTIKIGDPSQNTRNPNLTPHRVFTNQTSQTFWDMDPIMANYDTYVEVDTGETYYLSSTEITNAFSSPNLEVPLILVIPFTEWIPPWEYTIFTEPYGYFDDFYTNGTPDNWYEPQMVTNNNFVGDGGLSWGPYP